MDAHELLSALKNIAISLGYTPTRDEFIKHIKNGKALITEHFGSYAVMIHASGLDPVKASKNKYESNMLYRPVDEVIVEHKPSLSVQPTIYTPTLIIGDTHFPWVHQPTLERIYEFAKKYQPKRIIQMGDLYDAYAHSKFPRSLNVYSPVEEERLAIEGATKMWEKLQQLCPQAECVQILGNHDSRAAKRTLELMPTMEHVVAKHLREIMTFNNVNTIHDPREEYVVEGVAFLHGYRSKIGEHRDYMLMNAVCGHIHRAGVSYRRFKDQTFWELNAGFCGDPSAKALSYTSQKISDYTLGFAWLDEYGPRFIHC